MTSVLTKGPPSITSPANCFQVRCGGVDEGRLVLERSGNPHDLVVRLRVPLLLDRLPHPGNGFHIVTGVDPGCVEQVLEPGTTGEPLGARQPALALLELLVQRPNRIGGKWIVRRQYGVRRDGIAPGASFQEIEGGGQGGGGQKGGPLPPSPR